MAPRRERFPLGCAVRLSAKGLTLYSQSDAPLFRARVGKVTGHKRDKNCVFVLWQGMARPQSFHRSFLTRSGA